ncbi:MAG: hypothetical protein V3V20_10975 [Algisphaera sp.]
MLPDDPTAALPMNRYHPLKRRAVSASIILGDFMRLKSYVFAGTRPLFATTKTLDSWGTSYVWASAKWVEKNQDFGLLVDLDRCVVACFYSNDTLYSANSFRPIETDFHFGFRVAVASQSLDKKSTIEFRDISFPLEISSTLRVYENSSFRDLKIGPAICEQLRNGDFQWIYMQVGNRLTPDASLFGPFRALSPYKADSKRPTSTRPEGAAL